MEMEMDMDTEDMEMGMNMDMGMTEETGNGNGMKNNKNNNKRKRDDACTPLPIVTSDIVSNAENVDTSNITSTTATSTATAMDGNDNATTTNTNINNHPPTLVFKKSLPSPLQRADSRKIRLLEKRLSGDGIPISTSTTTSIMNTSTVNQQPEHEEKHQFLVEQSRDSSFSTTPCPSPPKDNTSTVVNNTKTKSVSTPNNIQNSNNDGRKILVFSTGAAAAAAAAVDAHEPGADMEMEENSIANQNQQQSSNAGWDDIEDFDDAVNRSNKNENENATPKSRRVSFAGVVFGSAERPLHSIHPHHPLAQQSDGPNGVSTSSKGTPKNLFRVDSLKGSVEHSTGKSSAITNRRNFTEVEDLKIEEGVQMFGAGSWDELIKWGQLDRTAEQVRGRYYRFLRKKKSVTSSPTVTLNAEDCFAPATTSAGTGTGTGTPAMPMAPRPDQDPQSTNNPRSKTPTSMLTLDNRAGTYSQHTRQESSSQSQILHANATLDPAQALPQSIANKVTATPSKKIHDYFIRTTNTNNTGSMAIHQQVAPLTAHLAFPVSANGTPSAPCPNSTAQPPSAVTPIASMSTSETVPRTSTAMMPQMPSNLSFNSNVANDVEPRFPTMPKFGGMVGAHIPEASSTSSTRSGNKLNDEFYKSELSRLNARIAELENDKQRLESDLSEMDTERSDLLAELERIRVETEIKLNELQAAQQARHEVTRRLIMELVIHRSRQQSQERRTKTNADTLRLARLVVDSGMSYSERWEEGYAFQEIAEKLTKIREEKDDIERRKKLLAKKKSQANKVATEDLASTPNSALKADGNNNINNNGSANNNNTGASRKDGSGMDGWSSVQELYEADEIFKWRLGVLKKEEFDLMAQLDKLSIERDMHIREIRRIRDEDSSNFSYQTILMDRYLLVEFLGKGGFSEVWKAFDLVEYTDVALKIHSLIPSWSAERKKSYIKHALREYQIHKSLKHPRIVRLLDMFPIDESAMVTVLEFCEGYDLETYLQLHKTLPEKEAKVILLQLASGLKYLNDLENPIIHYDLKPGNILFNKSDGIKITDFGLSKIVESTPDSSPLNLHRGDNSGMMGHGSAVQNVNQSAGNMLGSLVSRFARPKEAELTSQGAGTYWYLPPECFERPGNGPTMISSKVDVWSVGVIYYEMLFGMKPFGHNKSQHSILKESTITNDAHMLVFPSKPAVSNESKEFIKRCLEYRKEKRPDVLALCQDAFLFPVTTKKATSNSNSAKALSASAPVEPPVGFWSIPDHVMN